MRLKLTDREDRGSFLIVWHLLAVLLILLGPTMARIGLPFWLLPEGSLPQVSVLVAGYLATALFLSLAVRTFRELPVWGGLLIGVLGFAVTFVLLLELVGLGYSRVAIFLGVVVGIFLAAVPYLVTGRVLRVCLFAVGITATATVLWAISKTSGVSQIEAVETRERSSVLVGTNFHTVRITYHQVLGNRQQTTGGGLDVYQDGFIVASAVGEFHRLSWDGFSLASEALDLPSPLNRDVFLGDNSLESENGHFRIVDILLDTASAPDRILASHYHWNPAERCVSIRISGIALPEGMGQMPAPGWETLFTAQPCIPFDGETELLTNHSGGRMAWASDGALLFTLGEMEKDGLSGSRALSQELDNHYGKIIRLDLQGGVEYVSVGHRNPEGLAVAGDGTIWSTEHGPFGGDELNLIRDGANYGWPLVTYGTESPSNYSWPPAEGRRDHGPYEEPVFAWSPSPGISQLLEVGEEQFPSWEGDLLIGSLRGASLYRVRVRDDGSVVHSERIPIGRNIRDLVEDQEGRVLMWTDQGELVSLHNAGGLGRTGEVVYSQCATCHEGTRDFPALGPDLRGVWGREAGRVRGYAFSDAFRSLDVEWNPETLDQFLADPAGFVPGTTMRLPGVDSPADREAVIEFLRTYQ